jgi:hypothetical protein
MTGTSSGKPTARRPTARRLTGAIGALLLAGAGFAAGCGTGTPPPSGTPSASRSSSAASATSTRPTPTASPTSAAPTPPVTDSATVFGADGIGPYLVGTPLVQLQSDLLVTGVTDSTTCAGLINAGATGSYAGTISLAFSGGKLASVRTTSTALVTPSGTKIGTPLADAQTLYGSRAEVVTGPSGGKALLIPVIGSGVALALYLDPTNTTVVAMGAGDATMLESAARAGQVC